MGKILIYSPNPIGKSMVGSAIRPWEFAKGLASLHQVVLISPGQAHVKPVGFTVVSLFDPGCKNHFKDADVLITQRLTFSLAIWTYLYKVKVIIDAYDPSPLELLEQFKTKSIQERNDRVFGEVCSLSFSFKMADGIVCASEKQRELWLGYLLSQKLITPLIYDKDRSLRQFLEVVPFGLSHEPPKKNGEGWREKYGWTSKEKIIVWGGGIWNWFDPLTLIKAMKAISEKRDDVKLIFMAVNPPDSSLPEMSMALEALQLARDLDLINKTVFFNHEWIPYDERQNYLLDADIGISIHFDHLETHFSFRTRILDYIWASLPMIVTEGDAFAEWIACHQLGVVVPYQDTHALEHAILHLIEDENQYHQMKVHLNDIRGNFYWNSVLKPLNKMIDHLSYQNHLKKRWNERKYLCSFILSKIKEKGFKGTLKKAFREYFA